MPPLSSIPILCGVTSEIVQKESGRKFICISKTAALIVQDAYQVRKERVFRHTSGPLFFAIVCSGSPDGTAFITFPRRASKMKHAETFKNLHILICQKRPTFSQSAMSCAVRLAAPIPVLLTWRHATTCLEEEATHPTYDKACKKTNVWAIKMGSEHAFISSDKVFLLLC